MTELTAVSYLRWIPLLPLITAAVGGLFGARIQKRFGERAISALACTPILVSFILACRAFVHVASLDHDARFLLDRLAPWISVGALRADISEDRKHLEALMKQCGVSTSLVRRAAAWLAEKAAEVKLRTDEPGRGALLLLEALDALSVGIEGKRLLWKALAAAGLPAPPGSDYAALERRAEEQRARVEELRLQSARAALGEGQAS